MTFFNYLCQAFSVRMSAFFSALYAVLLWGRVNNYPKYPLANYVDGGYIGIVLKAILVSIESILVLSPFWGVSLLLCTYSFKKRG
ncbi:hypothetical protein [Vibrio aestuarianus]|uniref:Uncharacterized protein n=1 Tax=Vibrio aestuarianus TaxID=28171 RepID=A0ABM9FL17_9VIBR|nr:hypothetical protein [Vibrio aestuarianus]MDE1271200.1 hypothetical protein [Vibrio aestuarianus]MDE1292466.1 hypothetical protein [Vibrio aestuarianus]MDE1306354.1 hypothetical protein [Vibrio aestuarianus]MDH5892287.1 hypothetical protein [Vibrio aestuarianus]MDH5899947.1 hypothetical protein [Vibrio aestuarianus]